MCQRLAVAAFSLKILRQKRGIILGKMNLELFLLFVHTTLFIVHKYFEFQVYMFSNGRGMTKCQFLLDNDDDTKLTAILKTAELNMNSNISFF